MRLTKIDISTIEYTYRQYDRSLFDSIIRIGFSFPISVNIKNDRYICVDGHKRLSVLQDILIQNPHYKRGRDVCVIVKNNNDTRSNDCWRGRNTH